MIEQSVEWALAGESEVLGENLPQRPLSTTHPTWIDLGWISGRRGGKPATNGLSYGTAYKTSYDIVSMKNAVQKYHANNLYIFEH
jgi:hypothetical protein